MSAGSAQDPLIKPVQDHTRTSHRISAGSSQHLLHISRTSKSAPWNSCKIVTEGPRQRTHNIFPPGSQRISQDQHRATTRAIWHAQKHREGCARERYQKSCCVALSDLTRTKCQEGCTSDIKIRTAPRWERSRVARSKNGTTVLCEHARSKCTWTSRKGTLVRACTVKKQGPRWSALIWPRPFTFAVRTP